MTITSKKHLHFKMKIARVFISFVLNDILEAKFIPRNDHHNNCNFRSYCQAVTFRYVFTSVCTQSLPLKIYSCN